MAETNHISFCLDMIVTEQKSRFMSQISKMRFWTAVPLVSAKDSRKEKWRSFVRSRKSCWITNTLNDSSYSYRNCSRRKFIAARKNKLFKSWRVEVVNCAIPRRGSCRSVNCTDENFNKIVIMLKTWWLGFPEGFLCSLVLDNWQMRLSTLICSRQGLK